MVVLMNMEMPECCGNCPCFHFENPMYCRAIQDDHHKRITTPYRPPRPDWCPLMDSDAVKEKLADGLAEAAYKAFQTKYDKCVDAKDFPIGEPPTFDHVGIFRFMNDHGSTRPKGLNHEQSTNTADAGVERG